MKKIAIIGSSGGHLFVLGGNDPRTLLEEIVNQAKAASIEVSHIAFVAASTSMDHVSDQTKGTLWTQGQDGPVATFEDTLKATNTQAEKESKKIAEAIKKGEVDGLVMVSADPQGINA